MSRIIIELHKQKNAADGVFLAKDALGNVIEFNPDELINDGNIQTKPTQAVLMALGYSSGSDVVSTLQKHDQLIDSFAITLESFRTSGSWRFVTIAYGIKGLVENVKAREACILSLRKTCSIVDMLKRAGACIEWQLKVNNISFTHIIEPPVMVMADDG